MSPQEAEARRKASRFFADLHGYLKPLASRIERMKPTSISPKELREVEDALIGTRGLIDRMPQIEGPYGPEFTMLGKRTQTRHILGRRLTSAVANLGLARFFIERGEANHPDLPTILNETRVNTTHASRTALAFSRLFSGERRRRVVGVGEILAGLQDTFGHEMKFSGVEYRVVAPKGLYLKVDPETFRLAIYNPIRNALNFTREAKERRVVLKAEPTKDARRVLIRVKDTGPGIPPEVRPRVYENGFSTFFGGTGTGLPISKKLIEESGGRIRCWSREGKGTTFTVSMPLYTKPIQLKQAV
jgi:signal transduction histidine kinase